jgi:hypothetical protein
MKLLKTQDALEELCIKAKQWAICFTWDIDIREEGKTTKDIQKSIPFLSIDHLYICYGEGVIFCDSKEETYNLYNQIYGDDNVAVDGNKDEKVCIYALVIGPNGFESER